MQGGGSLGAYECGVFKTLARHGIKFDIIAGTSIGAINAGIVAASKSGHPEKDLEDFLMDVSETVKIERQYHCLAQERGAIIDEIVKIERSEDLHFLFEDADFSRATIKKLISQGEEDAEKAAAKRKQ